MARTALTVQQIVRSGLTPTYSAANADGHSFPNGGTEYLHVKNGGGGSINVTVQTPNTVDGLAITDRVVAVPNGGERIIGPFPRATYNQGADEVYVDFSGVTSVTCGAFRP
jgi:hypothetical protein